MLVYEQFRPRLFGSFQLAGMGLLKRASAAVFPGKPFMERAIMTDSTTEEDDGKGYRVGEPLVEALARDFVRQQPFTLGPAPNADQIIASRLLNGLVVHIHEGDAAAERVGAIIAPIVFSIQHAGQGTVDELFRTFLEWWRIHMNEYRHLVQQ